MCNPVDHHATDVALAHEAEKLLCGDPQPPSRLRRLGQMIGFDQSITGLLEGGSQVEGRLVRNLGAGVVSFRRGAYDRLARFADDGETGSIAAVPDSRLV